jgi:hypothetical protein
MTRFNRSRRRQRLRGGHENFPCIVFEDLKYREQDFIELCKERYNFVSSRDSLDDWLKFTKAWYFYKCQDVPRDGQGIITSMQTDAHRDRAYYSTQVPSIGFFFDAANQTVLLYKRETARERSLRRRVMTLVRTQNMSVADASRL